MIKRKGQIVPKWLVKSLERKAQHVISLVVMLRFAEDQKW